MDGPEPASDCIAIITARGGSKRVPGKNIRPLAGKPLIAWTIAAALQSRRLRRVIVSTDDERIAAVARDAGAEVPFLRPPELAGDHSSHHDVIAHALDWLEGDEGRAPGLLCLLQPTSPLRSAADIDDTIALMSDGSIDCAISVARMPVHPAYAYRLMPDGTAEPFLKRPEGYMRSQDLEELYYVNGAVYVLRPSTFRTRTVVVSERPAVHVMPARRSLDIDDEDDFALAEALMGGRAGSSETGSDAARETTVR